MTTFLRLLGDTDKPERLASACASVKAGVANNRVFQVDIDDLACIPGTPFAYWVSDAVRNTFVKYQPFGGEGRQIRVGIQTGDDFRFVRLFWELNERSREWVTFAKGGSFAQYYSDVPLKVNWKNNGNEIRNFIDPKTRKLLSRPQNIDFCFKRGLTWSDRTTSSFSARVWPEGGVFSVKGSAGFFQGKEFFAVAVMNSIAFGYLIRLLVGAGDAAAKSYQVGVISSVPFPPYDPEIDHLARMAWSIKRSLRTTDETSHAFILPLSLREACGDFDADPLKSKFDLIQAEIDEAVFKLYDFDLSDRLAANRSSGRLLRPEAGDDSEDGANDDGASDDGASDDENSNSSVDVQTAFLSWSVGVAFGRFDWRLATGERKVPPEPEPFDPLPAKSPGMLAVGAAPYHVHPGILVDDPGHRHDLPRLIEDVAAAVAYPTPDDVRRWLQRDFFAHHLKQYSKSRRKAPIYWPLSTTSGGYTLWLYYPALNDQTLYTAANDFVGPKLEETSKLSAASRARTDRSRDEERQLEQLQDLEAELKELQDELLRLAPIWKPNHDDGVQISAAPLWRLFRHRPWQTVLKETWEKLERGDYDWAHLAMSYWPDRVREKCRTDKSLAIAHDLEDLYEPPPEKPAAGRRGRKRAVEAA
jgi:hypothetical protein